MNERNKIMTQFGQRLDSLRKDGEQKQDFCSKIGVNPTHYRKYLYERVPRSDVIIRIAEATGVSAHWLLTGEGDKFPPAPYELEGKGQPGPHRIEPDDPSIIIRDSPRQEDDPPARRIATKTTRRMSGRDLAALAASYILEMDDLSLDERSRWAYSIQTMEKDPELRRQLLHHWEKLLIELKGSE